MFRRLFKKIKTLFIIIIILGLVYSLVSMFYLNINRLDKTNITIKANNIPQEFNQVKILVFSDINGDDIKLSKLIEKTKSEDVDLVVFLGNLLMNNDSEDIVLLESKLKELDAPLGKYVLLARDDYDYGLDNLNEVYTNADFRIMSNDTSKIYNKTNSFINFAFLDAFNPTKDINDINAEINENSFTLAFAHDPKSIKYLDTKVNALFAGKTEHGKINLPLYGSLIYKDTYIKEHELINQIDLYLSSGISTSRPKIRLFSKPNYLIIKLESSN